MMTEAQVMGHLVHKVGISKASVAIPLRRADQDFSAYAVALHPGPGSERISAWRDYRGGESQVGETNGNRGVRKTVLT
jgi:hypothetical protein